MSTFPLLKGRKDIKKKKYTAGNRVIAYKPVKGSNDPDVHSTGNWGAVGPGKEIYLQYVYVITTHRYFFFPSLSVSVCVQFKKKKRREGKAATVLDPFI
jgi:hypothetical protein